VAHRSAPALTLLHTETDIAAAMHEALALAEQAIGRSDPNPRVGCVLLDRDGRTIGRGSTQQAGGPHAEVMALHEARANGHDPRGATAVVTLEPCSHHGRTPPCAEALIDAGLARVVAAMGDPNPLVAGAGFARLAAAGIAVEQGPFGGEAAELNVGFVSRMVRGRPFVRLKVAVSLDGRTALVDGTSRWITGDAARADGHAWRRRAGAVLTGHGTVRADDPRLDVRLVPTVTQPLRVVVDAGLQTPPAARILEPPGAALVVAAEDDAAKRAALEARGAEVVFLPSPTGGVDLPALLRELARRGVNELHVEAGERLNGSLLREGLVDELLVYMAPVLLGEGRALAALGPFASLAEGPRFRLVETLPMGDDLRLRLRPSTI
jgi:diaminohydroxyphosphoribosylaminopyrimidine deaminase/5-amino-6-(5-phosphoribosylamino)uracil reductase